MASLIGSAFSVGVLLLGASQWRHAIAGPVCLLERARVGELRGGSVAGGHGGAGACVEGAQPLIWVDCAFCWMGRLPILGQMGSGGGGAVCWSSSGSGGVRAGAPGHLSLGILCWVWGYGQWGLGADRIVGPGDEWACRSGAAGDWVMWMAQSLNGPSWGYFPNGFRTGTGHPDPISPPHLDTSVL